MTSSFDQKDAFCVFGVCVEIKLKLYEAYSVYDTRIIRVRIYIYLNTNFVISYSNTFTRSKKNILIHAPLFFLNSMYGAVQII